jgi:hypothetical protein
MGFKEDSDSHSNDADNTPHIGYFQTMIDGELYGIGGINDSVKGVNVASALLVPHRVLMLLRLIKALK